jgi:predicted enzyme related to lactoylglutathione lyase
MARVIHFEVPSTNMETSRKFYENVFGWKLQKWEGPTEYYLITTGDPGAPGIDGGLGGAADEMHGTVNTLGVDDLDAVLKQVVANGGEIVMPRQDIPGVGYLAYVREPGGTLFGLMEALPGTSM